MLTIKVVGWDSYNPRHDLKHVPWVRIESKIATSRKLFGLSPEEKWFWVYLLTLAGEQNKQGVVEADAEYLAHFSGLSKTNALKALEKIEACGLIEVDRSHEVNRTDPIESVRDPNGSVPYVTGRNGTGRDETNGTSSRELALAPAKVVPQTPGSRVWNAYQEAYLSAYRQTPIRNKKTNSLCKQLAERLGEEGAVNVVRFYLTHQKRWYVEKCHDLAACVADAEGLHTQMQAGHRVTASAAQHQDRNQDNAQTFAAVQAKLKAEGLI